MESQTTTEERCNGHRGVAGALACLALLMILAAAPSAGATPARYVFEMCDSALPGGGTDGVRFAVNQGVPLVPSNTCAQPGGSLGITETGHVSATFAFWSVSLGFPPGGSTESLTISAAGCGWGPGTKAFVLTQGFPSNCAAETQHIDHGASGLWIFLGCDGNYGPGCEAGPYVYAHYIAATEVDPVPPTLEGLAGSLLSGGVIRGHQTIGAQAHDRGGGLSAISVSVNGLPAAQPKVFNCNVVHADNASVKGIVAVTLTPCPTEGEAEWTLDTETYPFHDGTNTVEICASDFATLSDPNTACTAPASVDVDNSCAGSAVGGGEVLSAQFSGSNAEEITVPFEQGAEVTGRLATNAGDPIPGATLCVKAQTPGVDSAPVAVGTVTTDAVGHYSYQVPPGPDRELMIGYRHDSHQVARRVRFYSHARPTLKLRPRRVRNGKSIRLWGWVPGPNAAGRVVVLQASALHSRRWLTFRRATADGNGRFHARYHFSKTTHPTTYRIRALIPAQGDYPWQEGNSRPVRVRVLRVRKRRKKR